MLRTGARRPAVGIRGIGDRAVSMAVAMAGQEFPTTISGFPEAQSLMIPSRIGEVQRAGGVIRSLWVGRALSTQAGVVSLLPRVARRSGAEKSLARPIGLPPLKRRGPKKVDSTELS